MIKNGEKDFANPIGTGPFKFKRFEIGVRSLCIRNPDYWEQASRTSTSGRTSRSTTTRRA